MSGTQGQVESLSRGLATLAVLNARGPLSLGALSEELSLPRTTVRRILDTLIAESYCLRAPGGRLYGLAPGVERLTRGYGLADRLTAAALDLLPPFGATTGWPVALAVPEGLVMRVRVSTDFSSRFALERMRPGYGTPLAETTTGLIYLASLDPAESAQRLDRIYETRWRAPLRFARDEVEGFMTSARADGYLILERQFPEASLGVPLRVSGQVCGGLVLRYVRSAIRKEAVRSILLPQLRETADRLLLAIEGDQGRSGAVTGS